MKMNLKYFSIEEAEALIPRLKEIFSSAHHTKCLMERRIEEWRRQSKSLSPADEAVSRGQIEYLAQQLDNQLREVMALGCMVKDLDLGLIDFPARIEDREGYLCWKLGEDHIEHWHGLTEGYQGRKKITRVEKTHG